MSRSCILLFLGSLGILTAFVSERDAIVAVTKQLSRTQITEKIPDINHAREQRAALPQGSIFHCGWPVPNFYPILFPGVNTSDVKRFSRHHFMANSTENDFILFGMHGPCDRKQGPTKTQAKHLQKSFKGKALFFNGESSGDARGHNTFQIGMVPDSNRSVAVVSAAFFLAVKVPKEQGDTIFVPSKKPQNTGERGVIYMASHCVDYREEAADRISDIANLVVEYGGKCHGRRAVVGKKKQDQLSEPGALDEQKSKLVQYNDFSPGRNQFIDNASVYRQFRYCLVLENSNTPRYITEKIALAFLGGCIPIYYGTREVFDIFNEKAFIYYDVENPEPALAQINYMENKNRSAYEEMMRQPILANGTDTIEKYFSLRDDIGSGILIRRIREMLGYDPEPMERM